MSTCPLFDMTLHPRTGWGNRTFPSVHWRLIFQGQEPDLDNTLPISFIILYEKNTSEDHQQIRELSVRPMAGQDSGRTAETVPYSITLGWSGVMGGSTWCVWDRCPFKSAAQGMGSKEREGCSPSKDSVFQKSCSATQLCSTAKELFDKYFSGLFFLAQSYQGSLCICLRTHRECKPATFFPFKNQMISCGFNPAKLYQI